MSDTIPESQQPNTPVDAGPAFEQPVRKSRFVDEKDLLQIDLGNGDWVKIPARFSYGFTEQFQRQEDDDDKNYVAKMAAKIIKEWNLIGIDGQPAEVNIEMIRMLEVSDLMIVVNKAKQIIDRTNVPKVA